MVQVKTSVLLLARVHMQASASSCFCALAPGAGVLGHLAYLSLSSLLSYIFLKIFLVQINVQKRSCFLIFEVQLYAGSSAELA